MKIHAKPSNFSYIYWGLGAIVFMCYSFHATANLRLKVVKFSAFFQKIVTSSFPNRSQRSWYHSTPQEELYNFASDHFFRKSFFTPEKYEKLKN